MTAKSVSDLPLACDMSALSPTQRKQHIATSRTLFAAVTEIHELPDGYTFQLPVEIQWLNEAAAFIANERLCCPFLQFTLNLESQSTALWLALTANTTPDDLKLFLRLELGDYLRDDVVQKACWKSGI
ncbi:MAG: hypothetical protein K8I82_30615 [Anaerolineae bacterium]|nr:hypothetical protein [Anaerolineae bacterium]